MMRPFLSLIGGLGVALLLCSPAARANAVCQPAPYTGGSEEILALAERLTEALAPYPSLAESWAKEAPTLCIDDSLVEEQAYYAPKTNRIVVRTGLDPDLALAILIHEVRHLEQFSSGICPTTAHTLTDYMRSRLALEADASAIGIYVAWRMRESGNPGPWNQLLAWPTHGDLVTHFAEEIAAGGDDVAATSATFAQWFESLKRREIYAYAICGNYLDALDREKMPPGKQTLPAGFAERLCRMPDGRPYDCVLPP
ncbi:DUF6782 family putative metallopeptidase [Tabrizicola sp.]|uniref:DUF6782 family putative metallopeptidase n=1 Tax=Tabrizicola sp. TaxID=2005166 RepID=UPI0026310EF2|nr:DUF6782 family putative metallopeptidase [Tabrizicola sp.]MDM7932313.1 hypothetical protein [Tabrizicola sp.]